MSHPISLSRLSPVGLAILTALFLLAVALRAQDKPRRPHLNCPNGIEYSGGCAMDPDAVWQDAPMNRELAHGNGMVPNDKPVAPKPLMKATGITVYGCKTTAVYLSVKSGHILAPMWADKSMEIVVSNPMFCDPQGRVTFYVLPSQDYEIYVIQGRVEAR